MKRILISIVGAAGLLAGTFGAASADYKVCYASDFGQTGCVIVVTTSPPPPGASPVVRAASDNGSVVGITSTQSIVTNPATGQTVGISRG